MKNSNTRLRVIPFSSIYLKIENRYFHRSIHLLQNSPISIQSLPYFTFSPSVCSMESLRCSFSLTSTDGSAVRAGSSHRVAGEVHVIIGPMFAGKTTALLRRIKSESNSGRNVVMIKSSKDTRYAIDSVVTHDGAKFPCWALPDLSSFRQKFGEDAYNKLDVIGVDEAQFFDDLYDFCCNVADRDGKIIVVAGLDGDYLRRSFGSVLDVIPLADTVTKLTARCELCGKRAFFTLRKTEETRTELIAGADVYMPVCRHHYANGQEVIQSSKNVMGSRTITRIGSNLEALPSVI